MINEYYAKRFCSDDISLIENYEQAVNDKTQMWECHHRAEILPCGRFSRNDLKKFNLYYARPANELIFLTPKEHKMLHQCGIKRKPFSEEHKRKMSESHKGKQHSEETKRKMSESHKGKTFNHSEETRLKIAESRCGKKYKPHSEETRQKMSEARKLYWQKKKQLCES